MTAQQEQALTVRCPTCGAKPGQKCELNPEDSSQHGLDKRHAKTVEGFVYPRRGGCALFFRGRWNLEQSLPAMVQGKYERVLVLHNQFKKVSQTFGSVSILEADAGVVMCGS